MPLPSHHILCAGPYTVPFARLAAESALASCPQALRKELKLYIHLDSILWWKRRRTIDWLSSIDGVEVTFGRFGIRPGAKIPGYWHQRMINTVAAEFQHERHLAFIDADYFIADERWWRTCLEYDQDDVYAITVGLRTNRHLSDDCHCWYPIKTNLFTLHPQLHQRFNRQHFNKDMSAVERFEQEYPGLELDLGKGLDTMVMGSLIAQKESYRVLDIEHEVGGCHVGGFSHIKKSKLVSDNKVPSEHNNWITRVRLINRVLKTMQIKGWDRFIDRKHQARVEEATHFLMATPPLRERLESLPLTRHEVAFDKVLALLGIEGV